MSTPNEPKPYRIPSVDITKLDLDTTDGFIWSLVDSGHSLRELGLITALDSEEIELRLHRLTRLGVIAWEADSDAEPVSMMPPPDLYAQPPAIGSLRRPGSTFESVPTGLFDPTEKK